MVKTYHGHTNYKRIARLLCGKPVPTFFTMPRTWEYMGEVMTITPLKTRYHYTVKFRNDMIEFYMDVNNEVVIPIHMVNIIEDIDQTTFVTGTKIVKPLIMPKADERLYRVCCNSIFQWGKEII